MVISRTAVSIIREKMSKRKKVSGCSSSNLTESESRMYNEKTDCPVPKVSCVCKEVPLPTNVDGEECGVRMRCTNDNCHLVKFLLHEACFEQLEQNLLKILSSRGSARGWTSSQLRCNLWERKGLTLIKNEIPCRCGKGLMSRDVEFYKKHELEIAKKSQQLQVDNRQRKKKKNKLPLLNFNSNVPVSADLLQNGFSGGISRRMSYGQCSHSSSAPLFYGQALLSESESDFAYDLRRTSTPAPCKTKLIVEKPKPLSDDRPNSKTKIPGLQPMVAPKQRKSQSKLSRETAAAAAQKNAASAKEKQQQQRVKAEEEAKQKEEVDSSQEIVLLKREEEEVVVRSEPTSEEGEQQQQVKSGRQYTLFGTPGFFLGELLMADAKLPRLLLPYRYNSGSCGQTNVEGVEVLLIKIERNVLEAISAPFAVILINTMAINGRRLNFNCASIVHILPPASGVTKHSCGMSKNLVPIRNPAPHRGFNAKAREVLLDSPDVYNSGMRRSGSDEEFLRKVGLIRFRRTGSEELDSGGSTPTAALKCESGFDAIDGMPKLKSTNRKSLKAGHRLLADIGKTRSVGDLSKSIAMTSKAFPQFKIAKPAMSENVKETDEDEANQQMEAPKRTTQYKMQ
ncbi:hypothetical protein niasHT_027984 [Heterodera trifolii]|uniref:Headcase N-terminal domain-containing protein n=1 Tax=Heterodera trifolii TaxID=157864 RepID=A0ABD2KET5_9BILA